MQLGSEEVLFLGAGGGEMEQPGPEYSGFEVVKSVQEESTKDQRYADMFLHGLKVRLTYGPHTRSKLEDCCA